MIKCLIIDDEAPARKEIKYLLKDNKKIEVIGEARHGLEGLEFCKKLKPDLIFLDIQMPKISGIEVAEELMKSDVLPYIIFVTAYDEYAIKAFELDAIDYLLKPVSKQRFDKAINKVIDKIQKQKIDYQVELKNIIDRFKNNEEQKNTNRISVYKDGNFIPLDADEIIYASAECKSIYIYTTKGKFEYPFTLTNLENKLNKNNFFRSHRSYLININFIDKITPWFNSTYQIDMKYSNDKIPVSRNHVKEFKALLDIP